MSRISSVRSFVRGPIVAAAVLLAPAPAPGADCYRGNATLVFEDDFENGHLDAWTQLRGASEALALTLRADGGVASNVTVSFGLPFKPGRLFDATQVVVRDESQSEVATHLASLATWPVDGSQRSVLVAFQATLAASQTRNFTVTWGAVRTLVAPPLAPNPDGPVAATLDPRWYARSRATGFQVALADSTAFPDWETGIESALSGMSPAWSSYTVNCGSQSSDRSSLDPPHALYQRFTHRGGDAAYRRAREEAVWYRANGLEWYASNTVALSVCATGWDPSTGIFLTVLRRSFGPGMLADYLLTGDPAALAAVKGIGEAIRQNLAALTTEGGPLLYNERGMAWPLMNLVSYAAVDSSAPVLAALETLVDMTVAWQAASGAFEHAADPAECANGPNVGSPFMTSLLIDGLMQAHELTGDPRIPEVVVASAEWYRDHAITTAGTSFRYLWNCPDNSYDDDSGLIFGLLINHVFGAAFCVSNDADWLAFGDTMANHGIAGMYADNPWQWTQSTRTFMKYMGYRAVELAP